MGPFQLQAINFLLEKQKKCKLKIGQIGPLAVPLIMECTYRQYLWMRVTDNIHSDVRTTGSVRLFVGGQTQVGFWGPTESPIETHVKPSRDWDEASPLILVPNFIVTITTDVEQ